MRNRIKKVVRGLFRFRLRTLLVLLTVGLCWLGYATHRARVQQRAVNALTDAGVAVLFSYQRGPGGIWHVGDSVEPPGPEWLRRALGDDYFRRVDMVAGEVPEDLFKRLGDLTDVRDLSVSGPGVTNAGLAQLARLRVLQYLAVSGAVVGDNNRIHPPEPHEIGVTDAGMEHLGGLSHLKGLNVSHTAVTDDGVAALRSLVQLDSLTLRHNQIQGRCFARMKGLHRLFDLDVEGNPVDDAGMAQIANLKRLQYLNVSKTAITDEGLAHLRGHLRLNYLVVDDTAITDAALAHVATIPGLETLHLSNTNVTDAGLVHLEKMRRLVALDLDGTKVSDEGVAELRSQLPECNISRQSP